MFSCLNFALFQSLELIHQYQAGSNGAAHIIVDAVQRELQCCGYNSIDDWNLGVSMKARGKIMESTLTTIFPVSCCPINEMVCNYDNAFITPCVDLIKESYLNYDNIIGLIGESIYLLLIPQKHFYIIICCAYKGRVKKQALVYQVVPRINCIAGLIVLPD